ncbi:MAG TPA: DUF58 domain-containing protein [Candidatus Binatia bacterium]|nr:DUF58 domain-containing protein [Candidatus Binatia bacterium]
MTRNMSLIRRIFFRVYYLSTAVTYSVRRRLTAGGFLVLGIMVVLGAFGADTNFTMAYQAFALTACLLLVSVFWAASGRARFSGSRWLPRYGTAGVPMPYRIQLKNLNPRPQRSPVLLESLGDPRPTLAQYLHTPEPGEQHRNWFDRICGYYRWRWLLVRNLGVRWRDLPVPALLPGAEITLQHELLPQRRGILNLRQMVVAWPDPFGLCRSLRKIRCPQRVTILPKRYPISPLALPGKRQYQPRGVSLASSIGESEEFIALRDYRPGDPLKHVYWRATAKLNKPVIKEFQDEFFVRHALVLDTFSERGETEAFEEAVSVAASFACTIPEQESLLDLLFVGSRAYCFTSGRGVTHTEHLLEVLAGVSPASQNDFATLHEMVLRHTSTVTGCICVFLAWDEPRHNLVQQLRAMDLPVLVLIIAERGTDELDPGPMRDCPERFRFVEVGKVKEGLARL